MIFRASATCRHGILSGLPPDRAPVARMRWRLGYATLASPVAQYGPSDVGTFLGAHCGDGTPAVLRGFAANWAATVRWRDPEYIIDPPQHTDPHHLYARDRLISVERADNGVFSHASSYGRTSVPLELLFEHLAACARENDPRAQVYAAMLDVDELHPVLRQDIAALPPFVQAAAAQTGDIAPANIWLGRGASTPLHWDASSNWLVQICGRKQVRLYSPQESARLHPFPVGCGPPNASQLVDVEPLTEFDADEMVRYNAAWPGFTDATYQVAELSPGDALFIPKTWWHCTKAFEDRLAPRCYHNISLNFWF